MDGNLFWGTALLVLLLTAPAHGTSVRLLIKEKVSQLEVSGYLHKLTSRRFQLKNDQRLLASHDSTSSPEIINAQKFSKTILQFSVSKDGQSILVSQDGMTIDENSRSEIINREDSSSTQSIQGQMIELQGDGLLSRALPLSENVMVYLQDQKLNLVMNVDIDEYLQGVLSKEVSDSWPIESLKAQAIASRSYALSQMKNRKQDLFDVRSTVYDQVFSKLSYRGESIRRAVLETKGLVLAKNKKDILKAFFHADCGGGTSEPQNVWGGKEQIGTALDPECSVRPRSQWAVKMKPVELSKLLMEKKWITEPLKDIEFLSPDQAGRFSRVKFWLRSGQSQLLDFNTFRETIGFSKLKSGLLKFKKVKDEWVFEGRGHGHGAGLCQLGAKEKAKNGLGFHQILRHYYPSSQVVSLSQMTKTAKAL